MLGNQPELPVIEVYVALTNTPKERRVAYGSLGLGAGDRKILSKSFTVFRSPKTGGLYVSWPTYTTQKDGKTEYKDIDVWVDVEEAKYWQGRILDETNRLLGVQTVATSAQPRATEATPPAAATVTADAPAPTTPSGRRVGWKQKS